MFVLLIFLTEKGYAEPYKLLINELTDRIHISDVSRELELSRPVVVESTEIDTKIDRRKVLSEVFMKITVGAE